jgi:hypothetical protein
MLAHDEDCAAAIRVVAAAIKATGVAVEIVAVDDSPDSMGADDCLWVASSRELVIDGETVAEWSRCAMGAYGEPGRQCNDDEWCVSEDTGGGDRLPAAVAAALDALGIEDGIPDVPEPQKATEAYEEDEDGAYAVYWETVGDDAHVVARYADWHAAMAVCQQYNREFAARHPSGGGTTYLCGYGVREWSGGEWVASSPE